MNRVFILENESSLKNLPSTGTTLSSGYDVIATSEPNIVGKLCEGTTDLWESISYIEYKTGIHISPQSTDLDSLIFPRSSISKYNLVLANSIGLVDTDYRNEILVRFKYICQPVDFVMTNRGTDSPNFASRINFDKIYKIGDKICQLKFSKVERVEFTFVSSLDKTERTGGFGSTDAHLKKFLY